MPSKLYKPRIGIRTKLIAIFVLIKVVPLVLLVALIWHQLSDFGTNIDTQVVAITDKMENTISTVGSKATEDAVMALDASAREAIERLTSDTANSVAQFLYARDTDIKLAAAIPPTQENFSNFLAAYKKNVVYNGHWRLNADMSGWEPLKNVQPVSDEVSATREDNSKSFHYRSADICPNVVKKPLYLEMTVVDLNGMETLKVYSDTKKKVVLRDVSNPDNTYVKAEHYFAELKKLKPGEIYVSNVIGAYVGSKVIGKYTPAAAKKRNIQYAPERAGYAGKENPVGRRFQGIVRWATPIVENGKITGYVTLALDHTHIMEFTDHIVPTKERFSPISDASTGNYAFMWDSKGRNISHPRDYFIVGYNPETGEPAVPWLEDKIYDQWQVSGKPIREFLKTVPAFYEQGLDKKPAKQSIASGNLGLDGRYLNFAPQCTGWKTLTAHGGSGSFIIFWSGIWKLTTAATIPYYTGQYGASERGFGFVTIGANVDEFHQAAVNSKKRLNEIVSIKLDSVQKQKQQLEQATAMMLAKAYRDTSIATLTMIAIVILIAIWMASYLTKRITEIILGINRFEQGEMDYRLTLSSDDEIGQLGDSFNKMASKIETSFYNLECAAKEIAMQNDNNTQLMQEMAGEIKSRIKAEEDLIASELYYRSLIENVSDVFIIVDDQWIVEYVNSSAERLYGLKTEMIIGKSIVPLVHSDDLQHVSPAVMFANLGANKSTEYRLTDAYQQVHVLEVFIQKIENGNDDREQYLLSARDVTQRKLAEQENRTLRKVVDQAPSSIFFTDIDGNIEYVNPYFEKLTGYTFTEVEGENPRILNSGKTPIAVFEDMWKTISAGFVWSGEFINKKKNGELFDECAVIIPIKNLRGEIVHYAAIKESTTELKHARFKAEQANRAKSEFLSRMSHELRTPLNAISGFSQLLLMSKKNPVNDKQRNMVEQISSSGKYLLELINEILDLSSIEAGRMNLTIEEVNPVLVLEDCLVYIKPLARKYDVEVVPPVSTADVPLVLADSTRVKQVVLNLLTNAVKYNRVGGLVSIFFDLSDPQKLSFVVTDTGIGIAKEMQKELFVPFTRMSENQASVEGTGIGMTITKYLVEMMGGTIDFESTLGKGSKFWFTLPIYKNSSK